jgi:hypothetical protein
MTRFVLAVSLLCLVGCGSTSGLTPEERSKLDPAITRLLTAADVDERAYDVGVRSDGVKEFGVIFRTIAADELKSAGAKVQSVIGDIVTARVSLAELRTIIKLRSVRSVENGSTNYLH